MNPFRINYASALNRCAIFIFLILIVSNSSAQNRKVLDSLFISWKNKQLPDTVRLKAMHGICANFIYSNPDTVLILADEYKKEAKLKNNKKYEADAYKFIGIVNNMAGDFPKSMESYEKGLKLATEAGDIKQQSNFLVNIGINYENIGNLPNALTYYYKGLKIREQLGDSFLIGQSNINIANVFQHKGDYKKSYEYNNNAIKILQKTKDKQGIAQVYANMASTMININKVDSAIILLEIAIANYQEVGNLSGQGLCYALLANCYGDKNDYTKAIPLQEKSIGIYEQTNNLYGITRETNNLGDFYLKLKDYNRAIVLCKKAYLIAKENQMLEQEMFSTFSLAKSYQALNKNKEALENYMLYLVAHDSLINNKNTKEITQKEMLYAFDKQQLADSLKQSEENHVLQLEHTRELEKQRTFTWAGIIGFVVMLLFAFILFRGYRQKQKNNLQLEEKNELISKQKEIVEEKQKEILDSIRYARRIQTALITNEKYIERALSKLKEKIK